MKGHVEHPLVISDEGSVNLKRKFSFLSMLGLAFVVLT